MNETLGKILHYIPVGYNERRNEVKETVDGADAISLGTAKGARTLKYAPKEIAEMKKTTDDYCNFVKE